MTGSLGRVVGFADAIKSDFPCWRFDGGWIVRCCNFRFCNRCDIDDGDVEGVVFDGGSSQESVGYCDIKFVWCQDMVKDWFVRLVDGK